MFTQFTLGERNSLASFTHAVPYAITANISHFNVSCEVFKVRYYTSLDNYVRWVDAKDFLPNRSPHNLFESSSAWS